MKGYTEIKNKMDFDAQFRWFGILAITIGIASFGFTAWVIIKLMQHWSII